MVFDVTQRRRDLASSGNELFGYEQWEERAREVLNPQAFEYISGGSGSGETMRSNRESFFRWKLVPRILKNVETRDLTTRLYGDDVAAPLLLAPIGFRDSLREGGELATARAAAALGIPFILGTFTTHSIEDVAKVMGKSVRWFQLYPSKDLDVMISFVHRAEASGYSAVVMTVDVAGSFPRYTMLKNKSSRLDEAHAVYFTDPAFKSKLPKAIEEDREAAFRFWREIRYTSSLTWEDVRTIRQKTKLPVLLKGILHPEDARLALDCGIDGLIVSNHGGRRLDGEVASLDILPEVCEVIQGRVPILLDSGVRNGAEVAKAIALGASAVLLGRAHAYGLAVAGQEGVQQVVKDIMFELDQTLAICGCRTPAELDRSLLRQQP